MFLLQCTKFVSCFLVIYFIPAFLPKSVAWPDWRDRDDFKWAENCEFEGHDLHSREGQEDQCIEICADTASCTHFTWTGNSGGTCSLKGGDNLQAKRTIDYSVCGYLKRGSGGESSNEGSITFQTVGANIDDDEPTTIPTTTSCGSPTNQPRVNTRIIGGSESSPNSWPWQALLKRYHLGKTFYCGASLINNQWLLTAAHCVQEGNMKISPQNLTIFLGAHNFPVVESTGPPVTKSIVHPNYNTTTLANDIALIKLGSSVRFNSYISPICLPAAAASCPSDRDYGYVTGWGRTTVDGLQSSSLLQVELPVVNLNRCQTNYRLTKYSIATGGQQFCAGSGGKDSCQGDSGGPFVMKENGKWYQKGIVSWGYSCAKPDFPGVYTCVSHYRNWIDQEISLN